jgi:carbonic anhydrase
MCVSQLLTPTNLSTSLGFKQGECFTVRNIANCVMNADLSINAATQFAIEVLGVKDIIVLGHRDCGGIKAAMTRQSFGTSIDMYVRHVRDVYRTHIREIDALENETDRLNLLINKHVVEQCVNVYKMGFVQRARRNSMAATGVRSPQIHGLVYDPSSGMLEQLDVGISAKAKDYGKVYDVLA